MKLLNLSKKKINKIIEKENEKTRKIDIYYKKKKKKYYNLNELINIIKEYCLYNKLLLYGGTAINELLCKQDKFYDFKIDDIDLDYYSYNPIKHCKNIMKLIDKYKFKLLKNYILIIKNGLHVGTYRIIINNIPLIDITYIEKESYEILYKLSIKKNKFYIVPKDYLRYSLYYELSTPSGDLTRWDKNIKRLLLFNKNNNKILKNNFLVSDNKINILLIIELLDYFKYFKEKDFTIILTGDIVYNFYVNLDQNKKSEYLDRLYSTPTNITIPKIDILFSKNQYFEETEINNYQSKIFNQFCKKVYNKIKKYYKNIQGTKHYNINNIPECYNYSINNICFLNIYNSNKYFCHSFHNYKNFNIVSLDELICFYLLRLIINNYNNYQYLCYNKITDKINNLIEFQYKYINKSLNNKNLNDKNIQYFQRAKYCKGFISTQSILRKIMFDKKSYNKNKIKYSLNTSNSISIDNSVFKLNDILYNKSLNEIGKIVEFNKNNFTVKFPNKKIIYNKNKLKCLNNHDCELKFINLREYNNNKTIKNLIDIGILNDNKYKYGFSIGDKVKWSISSQNRYKKEMLHLNIKKYPNNKLCNINDFNYPFIVISNDSLNYSVYPEDIIKV